MAQFRIRIVRIPRWQIMLAATVLVAFLVALFLLAFGVFLILFPIVLLAGLIAWLIGGGRVPPPDRGDGPVIDGEYRVLDRKSLDRDRHG